MLQVDEVVAPGFSPVYFNAGPAQLTALFAQKVVAQPLISGNPAVNGSILLTFGAADRTTFTDGSSTINTGLASGVVFQFYTNPSTIFRADFSTVTDSNALADSFATATAGTKVLALGFNGDATPGIIQGAGDNGYFYDIIQTTPTGTTSSTTITGYGGLNVILGTNFSGATIISGATVDTKSSQTSNFGVDVTFESSITPNTTPTPPASPWDFYSHDPAVTSVLVPLPASFWTGLLTLSLMGIRAAVRRRHALGT